MIAHPCLPLAVMCAIVWAGMIAGAAPASQPATQIKTWFAQLADRDTEVRQRGFQNLMGLAVGDLPVLQKVVEQSRPLLPSQRAVLREIVSQVYISSLPYESSPEKTAFLGVRWPANQMLDLAHRGQGVLIDKRVMGFPAYRMLRDGDLIVGIRERPDATFDNTSAFGDTIKSFRPGQTITMQVLRDGKRIEVEVLLCERPAGLDHVLQIDAWTAERQRAADEYWQRNFAPLMGEEIS